MSTKSALGTVMCLAILMPAPAGASLITATFSGTANGFATDPYTGERDIPLHEPVSGSFTFSTEIPDLGCDCYPPVHTDTSFGYFGFVFHPTIDIFGSSGEVEPNWPQGITLEDDGARQSLTILSAGPYWYTNLFLVDADRRLFHDFDPATLDLSQVDLGLSRMDFSGNIRYFATIIDFEQMTVDGVPVDSVPEPASLALMGIGLLSLAAARRRSNGERTTREARFT